MEENLSYSLNLSNFRDIPFQKYYNDFTFIVNGKRYQTTRVIADILSPDIRKMHYIDGSLDEYSIDLTTKYGNFTEKSQTDQFNDFLKLALFDKHQLSPNQQELFSLYFYTLGNIEEYVKLHPSFKKKLTEENVFDRLFLIEKINPKSDSQKNYRRLIIDFMASNFESINKNKLNFLQINTIDEILNSTELQLTDEDSLLNFIINLYENDRSASILFKNINFENLSQESIRLFIDTFCFEDINFHIWHSICYCLSKSEVKNDTSQNSKKVRKNKKMRKNNKNYVIEEFSDDSEDGKKRGVIHFLTKKTGGNIHDNGTVEIWSNSINLNDMKYHPKNLFDHKSDNFFASNDSRFASICIDFKDRFVKPSGYMLKTCNGGENSAHLKNWVVEASNDSENWIEIDRHRNEEKIRGRLFAPVFKINDEDDNDNGMFYRFIRIRQTGESWYTKKKGNYFILREFELFGKLKELSIEKFN